MKSTLRESNTIARALLLSLFLLASAASAQYYPDESRTPVGVWEIEISFRDCTTGEVVRTRPGLVSFMQGGVMQEFGTGSAPADRSDAQGVWKHDTAGSFTSVSKAFRFATDGTFIGSVKLYRQFHLTGSGIEVDVQSEIFNSTGALIANGCATESGIRLK